MNIFEHARSLDPIMNVAVEATIRGGEVIKSSFGRKQEVQEKAGKRDYVTQTDKDSEGAIIQYIIDKRPFDGIQSEELNEPINPTASSKWVIDPLDGTEGLVASFDKKVLEEFENHNGKMLLNVEEVPSVMIAFRNELLRLGVVYFPLTEELFYALNSKGAYKNGLRLLPNHMTRSLGESISAYNEYGIREFETCYFRTFVDHLRQSSLAVKKVMAHSGIALRMFDTRQNIGLIIHDNDPKHIKQAKHDTLPIRYIIDEIEGAYMLNSRGELYDSDKPDVVIITANKEIADHIRSF